MTHFRNTVEQIVSFIKYSSMQHLKKFKKGKNLHYRELNTSSGYFQTIFCVELAINQAVKQAIFRVFQ